MPWEALAYLPIRPDHLPKGCLGLTPTKMATSTASLSFFLSSLLCSQGLGNAPLPSSLLLDLV